MAIGKILQRYWQGNGNRDDYQGAHIILLPSFPESKYSELAAGKQYATSIGSGTTLWAESGSQLEVTGTPGYPRLVVVSLEKGVTIYGKVTNDDKEAMKWIKTVGDRLFPSRLFTSTSKWNTTWKPLKDSLDSADTAGRAADILSKIRGLSDKKDVEMVPMTTSSGPGNPGTMETGDAAVASADEMKSQGSAAGDRHREEGQALKDSGKQALTDAKNQVKNEVNDWWDSLGTGWQIGVGVAGAAAVVLTAMAISERVD